MCLSLMEMLASCSHRFCLGCAVMGFVLVLVVFLAACLLWSLCFHVLIFGYRVAMETTTVLCLPLLWLPANQCLLWEIICGGVSRLVPLLWLLDVCVVAVDFRGKPFELRKKEQTSFPFLVICETQI